MQIFRTQEGNENWTSSGELQDCEIKYFVSDPTDKKSAIHAVMNDAPAYYEGLPRSGIRFDSYDDDGNAEITVTYKADENKSSSSSESEESEEPESTMNFECSNGTTHIIKAREQAVKVGNIDAGGFIGWHGPGPDADTIDGVDIVTAVMRMTYTKTMRVNRLTTKYCRTIANLTGTVNNASFKGWKAGEVLFLGASFSVSDGESKVKVTFNFAIQPTEKITIEGRTINKYGHDVLTVMTKKGKNANGLPTVKVIAAHLNRVYRFENFDELGL